MGAEGLLTLLDYPLLEAIFSPSKAEEARFGLPNERLITTLGGKIAPALWVESEKAPLVVADKDVARCVSRMRQALLIANLE